MRAGRLDELGTPQSPAAPAYADGERTTDGGWTDGAAFWASVEAQSGSEATKAGQVDAGTPYVVTARFGDASSVTAGGQIVRDNGDVLEVVRPPREVGRREWVEFLCVHNADGGA